MWDRDRHGNGERSREQNRTSKTREQPQSFNLSNNSLKRSLDLSQSQFVVTDSREDDVRSDDGDDDIIHIRKQSKSDGKRIPLDVVPQVPRKLRSSINKALPADPPRKTTELDSFTSDERYVIEILSELKSIHQRRVNSKLSDEHSDPNPSKIIAVSPAHEQEEDEKEKEAERNVIATTASTSESKHLSGKEGCTKIMEKAEAVRPTLDRAAKVEPTKEIALPGSLPNQISSSNGNSQIMKSQVPPPPKPGSEFSNSTQHCDSEPITMKEIKTCSSIARAHGNKAADTLCSPENRVARSSSFPTIKPSVGSSSGRRGYSNNCKTHLRIANFIQNFKNQDKKKQSIFQSSIKLSDRQNCRLNPEPKPKQFFDFMKLSTLPEPRNPEKKMDSPGPQIHVAHLQRHMTPFSHPPVHHSLPFTEVKEQAQIPFLDATSIQQREKQQQQQMWQAHMAGYGYNLPVPLGQHRTLLTIDNRGRGLHPIHSNTQQSLVLPNQASNTVMMQHRQQNGQNHPRNFNVADDGSPQLKVLYCSSRRR